MIDITEEQCNEIAELMNKYGCDVFVKDSTLGMKDYSFVQTFKPEKTIVMSCDIRTDIE